MKNNKVTRKAGKTKISIAILLGFLTVSFIFISPFKETVPLPPGGGDKFVYGAIQSIWTSPNYDSLGLNLTHGYVNTVWDSNLGRYTPQGWAGTHDSLTADVSSYISDLRYTKQQMYSHNESRFLYHRPKIEWLAYGQSSIYEAEYISTSDPLWFYSFNVRAGESIEDSGKGVLHCTDPAMGLNAGIVLKYLKANTEQCKRTTGDGTINHWQSDSECDWYIKPRIRIDSTFAHNSPNANVCRIIVLNQNRDTIKNLIIKGRHFLKEIGGQFFYNGQYLEEFFYLPGDSTLTIHGDWGNWWELCARGSRTNEQGYNLADIQVYWYDNCEMWLDYVKVENDVANDLMNPNSQFYNTYNQWIDSEAVIASESPAVWKFYVEIVEFNNLPCINYINQKLRQVNQDIDLIVDFDAAWGPLYHVPYQELSTISTPEWLYENFYLRGGFSMVFAQCYPMRSRYYDPPNPIYNFSEIPPTLPSTNGPGILALPSATTDDYDDWLQNNFDYYPFFVENNTLPDGFTDTTHPCGPLAYWQGPKFYGYMRYTLQTFDEISRLGNLPFVFMPQAHQWYYPWEIDREPTHEELEVMANLAVSYGARGLMWWWYPGYDTNLACPQNSYGMSVDGVLRDANVYGQCSAGGQKAKWEVFRDIGIKMKAWEPYVMSFDNTNRHSYIYYDENDRNALLTDSYFRCVLTYKQGTPQVQCNEWLNPGGMPDAPYEPGLIYECKEYTYLQVATFENPNEINPCYFMIVNRRCSPVSAGNPDGKRKIRVLFDNSHTDINSFYNWNIKDVATGKYVDDFNRLENKWVNLDWFGPGEGKLYKLVPIP